MSKAEDYIKEHTRQCSNTFWDKNDGEYNCSWLTPDQARKAVEVAREETIEQTLEFLKDILYKNGYVGIIDLCDEYIKVMKNE